MIKIIKNYFKREDNEKYLTEFESEDQIYSLVKKYKKPAIFYYYIPGDHLGVYLRENFLKSAKKYSEFYFFLLFLLIQFRKCFYTKINCSKHYDICRNKEFKNLPELYLMKLSSEKDSEVDIKLSQKSYSEIGIESFLEVYNLFLIYKLNYLN